MMYKLTTPLGPLLILLKTNNWKHDLQKDLLSALKLTLFLNTDVNIFHYSLV